MKTSMRWFLAFFVLCCVDAVLTTLFLVLALATLALALSSGLSLVWAIALTVGGWLSIYLVVRRVTARAASVRDRVFSLFGIAAPPPSNPQALAPRIKAYALAALVTPLMLLVLSLPLALVLWPFILATLSDLLTVVAVIFFLLLVPGYFSIALDRALEEFGANPRDPGIDPNLSDRLRERWQSEIDRDRNE